MKTYLVSGGAGFIGSNVANHLLEEGHRVIILDNLSREGSSNNLQWLNANHDNIILTGVSIQDVDYLDQILDDYNVDGIFHFAAQVGVGKSIEDPVGDFLDNTVGTLNVLEGARKATKKPHIIFASTNKVYGEFETNKPISEAQPLKFCTPYGCSKGAAEQYMLDYYRIYKIPTTVFRMSCIYGNRQWGTSEQGWLAHFMFSKANKKPVIIYGDGSVVRDALYIDDYVDLCIKTMGNKKAYGEVFNIGGGDKNKISVLEAVKKIGNEYTFDKLRPADQLYYVSDISRAQRVLNWTPKISVEEGLKKLEEWVQSQK